MSLALILMAVSLSGCSFFSWGKRDPFAGVGSPMWSGPGPMPKGGGRYMIGKPYEVAGESFYPKEDPNYDRTGIASWYGPQFHKRMTSNGEWFDMDYLTAAHATMPLPSYAKVTNLENRRTIVVRVNDRGPFVNSRVIDLSRKSADLLGYRMKGTAKVRVQYIGPAPLGDKGTHLMAMNEELRRGTPMRQLIAAADARAGSNDTQLADSALDSMQTAAANAAAPQPVYQQVVYQQPAPQPQPIYAAQPVYLPQPVYPQQQVQPQVAYAQPVMASAAAMPRAVMPGYYVQVGAYGDPGNARRAQSQLAGVGQVDILPMQGSNGTIYRVRIGPLPSQDQAASALAEAQATGHVDARIVLAQN